MKHDICSKLLVFGVVFLFFGLILIPINTANYNNSSKFLVEEQKIKDISENDVYKLLIITPDNFYNLLEPLVKHKTKYGIPTKIVTLTELYDQMHWHGRDKAEKIKYFIKLAIEEWGIEYVLLIGGKKRQTPFWHLPVRYVKMDDKWEHQYISDLYYADIYDSEGNFSSWDWDRDGLFSEWQLEKDAEDKSIDLYPDVAVGRLPCRNKKEVKIMVKKIIDYETTTYDRIWFKDMLVVAGDTYPEIHNPKWIGYEGEYYAELALENMTGFNPIRLYTSDGSLGGQQDVIRSLSKGCGFVYFVGHGNPKVWGNNAPNEDNFVDGLSIWKMHKLKNKNMYPVCVVSGCHNSQFDVYFGKIFEESWIYFTWVRECWAWRITRKIGGGSIATIGCSALGYTKEDKDSFKGGLNEIEAEFFHEYGQNKIDNIGDTWSAAVKSYINKYPIDWDKTEDGDSWIDTKVVQSWVLFGDPSLKIGGYPLQK